MISSIRPITDIIINYNTNIYIYIVWVKINKAKKGKNNIINKYLV